MAGTLYCFGEADTIATFKIDWVQTCVFGNCNVAFDTWLHTGLDMVLCTGDCPFWDSRIKGYIEMERRWNWGH